MPEIQSTLDTTLPVPGNITLHLSMGESDTQVKLGVRDKLAVHVSLDMVFIDRFIKSLHPAGRKIVPHHSAQISTLLVQVSLSEAEKNNLDIHHEEIETLTPMVRPIERKAKDITVARPIALKAIPETQISVSIREAGLIQILLRKNASKMILP